MTDADGTESDAGGWQRVRLDRVAEVSLPPGVTASAGTAHEQPIGVWEGSGITLVVDASPYADPVIGSRTGRGGSLRSEPVDGRPAHLANYEDQDGAQVVALRFEGDASRPAGLTVTARGAPEVDTDTLLRIVRSVRLI
jgi:hypothetical protein